MTDLFIEGALWILIVLGACAGLYVLDWCVDWFCDAFDSWIKSICENYADDDDFVAR